MGKQNGSSAVPALLAERDVNVNFNMKMRVNSKKLITTVNKSVEYIEVLVCFSLTPGILITQRLEHGGGEVETQSERNPALHICVN